MNATSALVLILILSFAADRLVKALIFGLSYLPFWQRRFPDPKLEPDRVLKLRATNRQKLVYSILVAIVAGVGVWFYEQIRIIQMLAGPETPDFIDMVVTVIVVMGGSDLVSRLLQISGVGDIGTGPAAAGGRNQPIEIQGRLVLENPSSLEGRSSD
ncbi:MAG: hypothetical protein AAFY56_03085 [Pseudomonadota bacterium]